jgi:DNA-directed RNA polymerase subunit RPC12/RpoP
MARCSYCGRETELHEAGVAMCTACGDRITASKPGEIRSVHTKLVQALMDATSEHSAATAAYNRAMWDIPSAIPHPDGVQRIHSISQALSVSKQGLARAHSRLADFLDTGAIPEDLVD